MSGEGTFDVSDGALNKKLDNLSKAISETRSTLDEISSKLILSIERQSKQAARLQIIYLVLTLFIAGSACTSAYFSYRSVQIFSEQQSLQSTQVLIDQIKAAIDVSDFITGFTKGLKEGNKTGESKLGTTAKDNSSIK